MHKRARREGTQGKEGRQLRRRGLLAGIAAVAAAVLARASERVAEAANGDPIRIGQSNSGTLNTTLSGTDTKIFEVFSSNGVANSAAIVASPPQVSGGRAFAGFANYSGTYAFFAQTSSGATAGYMETFDSGTGVHGKSSGGIAVRGEESHTTSPGTGVLGQSRIGRGVFGYSGGRANPVLLFENTVGVQAVSENGIGLSARSTAAEAIKAVTTVGGGFAVTVQGPSGIDVSASNNATGTGLNVVGGDIAVRGVGRSAGLRGQSEEGNGVFATNASDTLPAVEAINESSGAGAPGVKAVSNNNRALLATTPNAAGFPAIHAEATVAGGGPGIRAQSVSSYGVYGTSTNNVGVYGQSAGSPGVLGNSTNNYGVYGVSASNLGVIGQSTPSIGVYGISTQNYGVYGVSTNSYGVAGTSANNVAVYGTSSGSIGVLGNSGTSVGLYGISNSGTGVFGQSSTGNAGLFVGNVVIQGDLTVLGSYPKSAAVPHPDGSHRRLYCMEAPESYFEDLGRGHLTNGRADVRLDRDFAALVHSDNYDVFLTPKGDCRGLYVSSQSPTGFEVRELQGGTSSLSFSYRVVARRRDIARPRLDRVTPPAATPRVPEAPQPVTVQAPPTPPTEPAGPGRSGR